MWDKQIFLYIKCGDSIFSTVLRIIIDVDSEEVLHIPAGPRQMLRRGPFNRKQKASFPHLLPLSQPFK